MNNLDPSKRLELNWKDRWVCLYDNTSFTGFDRHYIYHPAWAMRVVKKINPEFHIDISSTLHFCTSLSAFIPVKFFDFRPANVELDNLSSNRADLTKLHFDNNSISSLSCMHTVEHIGLGRYGDTLDIEGDLKAMKELARVVSPRGSLLLVVPVGSHSMIQFNAHRVYRPQQIISYFENLGFTLKEFALIPENEIDGGLVINPSKELLDRQRYACGCFWLVKK